MKKICLVCLGAYKTEDRRRKYCGRECYRAKASAQPNAGAFRPGLVPWNKNKKGIHLSPETEFKPGRPPVVPIEPVGAVRIRIDKNGAERAFVKTAQPNVWIPRHRLVWEKANGSIPPGMVVHHLDHNPLNDELTNLALITRQQHIAEHRNDLRLARERLEAESQGLSLRDARAGQIPLFGGGQ